MKILSIDHFINFTELYLVFDYSYCLEDLLSLLFTLIVRE